MKLKKLAAMLFTLCLIIAMMPFAVFADDDSEREGDRWGKDLYILGRKVEISNGVVPASMVPREAGTITYNKNEKTLTLEGVILDLDEYEMPGVTNNYAAAISASDDLTIVLKGENKIYSKTNAYDANKTYIYGIKNSGGDTTIEGSGEGTRKLKIILESVSGKSFTGIDCKRKFYVNGCDLEVNITGDESSTGIDIFGDFGIDKKDNIASNVTVTVAGNGSTGVDGTGMFDGSYVVGGSTLEMTAGKSAFRCYLPSDSLKETPAKVNVEAASSDTPWNKTDTLATFKYVKFTSALDSVAPTERAAKLYLLGRKIDSDGIISSSTVPHEEGTITYKNGVLTLNGVTLDLKDYQAPVQGGNLIAAIYGTSDLNIVLEGESKIIFTDESYGPETEYAYGIESWGNLSFSGNGTLNIKLADGVKETSNPNTRIYGIGCDEDVYVEGASVNINMGDDGKATGMYLWGPVNLTDAARVVVTSEGTSNIAVNGVNDIAKSTVSADSWFEMTSGNIAFNCWTPGADLKEAGAMVNLAATSEGAWQWDPGSGKRIRDYQYVRFPADDPDVVPAPVTNEFTITYDLNGGTLDGQTGVVTKKIASGTVITLPLPTRTGYEFDYWEGSKYNAGDKYTVSEDHTFKAIWKTAKTTDTGSKDKGKSSRVKTGDDSTLYTWIALMAISVLGFACVAIGRKISGRNR